MGLNKLNNTETDQSFQQLISSASSILKVEQEKENRRLENSFIYLIDEAKVLLDCEVKGVTRNLRQQFLTFLAQAQMGLRENQGRELKECSEFLENAKSVLCQDTLSKITYLDAVLNRARPTYEKINIFSILNITRKENPQSYFLAWLLNPDNPHGFGDTILRTFLKKACDIVVGKFEYDSLKITNLTVETQRNIEGVGTADIEVVGKNFICVIENKVGAGETLNHGILQTKRYADYYTKRAKEDGKFLLLLYLVPSTAKQPSDKSFKQILYSDIAEIIKSVLRTSTPPPEVSCLIEMFLHNIRRGICHEFKEYFEAEKLLRESHENPSYFARPDKYESLGRLTSKLQRRL